MGLPWWLSGKESSSNSGDMGLIPGSPELQQILYRLRHKERPVIVVNETKSTCLIC